MVEALSNVYTMFNPVRKQFEALQLTKCAITVNPRSPSAAQRARKSSCACVRRRQESLIHTLVGPNLNLKPSRLGLLWDKAARDPDKKLNRFQLTFRKDYDQQAGRLQDYICCYGVAMYFPFRSERDVPVRKPVTARGLLLARALGTQTQFPTLKT